MAYEHLWQNEAFRKAFQRWWDEDWSWEGLGKKYRRRSLGAAPDEDLGTLQDVWHEEKDRLIPFGKREWTRFHLPPFDRDGNPCPADIWNEAKSSSCSDVLVARLKAAGLPDEAAFKEDGLSAVTDFAELRGVVFPEAFAFDGEDLVANLASVIFLGDFKFGNNVVAWFDDATFSGNAWFTGATFSGDARFDDATFSGTAWFGGATFSGTARFGGATFSGTAGFTGATFSGNAWFARATFGGNAWFAGATFSEDTVFDRATFSGNAWFGGATFSGTAWFGGATFSGTARFGGTTPFAKGTSYAGARFFRLADFSGRAFAERTNFSGGRFLGVPKFHGAKLHPDTSFLNAVFRDGKKGRDLPRRSSGWFGIREREHDEERGDYELAHKEWKAALRIYRNWQRVPFGLLHPKLKGVRRRHDSDAEEYEIAYRQLRRLCAEIGSIEYEGMFHALELRAHRARTDTQFLARAASWLYEILSDYGRSLGRPLGWLAATWVACWTVYWGIPRLPSFIESFLGPAGAQGACAHPGVAQAFVVAGKEFLPSLFGAAYLTNQPHFLQCEEKAAPLLFFGIGVLQVITFIALITLFLIALRRRFQMR